MALSLSKAFVLVDDPDKALEFYRDGLGLELRMDVPNGEYRWLTLGAAGEDASVIVSNYLEGTEAEQEAVRALLAKGSLNAVHFNSDDLEATFSTLRASGAEIVEEPTDQPWGVRDGAVRDPAGNLIRIQQA
jgi:catechol 2,3-dioxygenase-like lactoylglutathione lyase family enzyme